METKTIQMVFNTDTGKTYTISLDNAVYPPVPANINACIAMIETNPIFISKNGKPTSIKEVNFITKNVEAVNLVQ